MKTATWNDLLIDLKLREIADSDFSFLYKLLKGRNPKENISHEEIPSYKQHVKFVKSKPYQKWYIIEKNRKKIGAIYFSKQNEIGIHFLPKISSESIRQTTMQKLIKKNPGKKYFTNVNPKNLDQIKFLKKNGINTTMVTALIVDDENKNRESLAKLIDQFCYGVKVIGHAENVKSAEEFIKNNQPQI